MLFTLSDSFWFKQVKVWSIPLHPKNPDFKSLVAFTAIAYTGSKYIHEYVFLCFQVQILSGSPNLHGLKSKLFFCCYRIDPSILFPPKLSERRKQDIDKMVSLGARKLGSAMFCQGKDGHWQPETKRWNKIQGFIAGPNSGKPRRSTRVDHIGRSPMASGLLRQGEGWLTKDEKNPVGAKPRGQGFWFVFS